MPSGARQGPISRGMQPDLSSHAGDHATVAAGGVRRSRPQVASVQGAAGPNRRATGIVMLLLVLMKAGVMAIRPDEQQADGASRYEVARACRSKSARRTCALLALSHSSQGALACTERATAHIYALTGRVQHQLTQHTIPAPCPRSLHGHSRALRQTVQPPSSPVRMCAPCSSPLPALLPPHCPVCARAHLLPSPLPCSRPCPRTSSQPRT